MGAPLSMPVHLRVATAKGEGSHADSTSNFLLHLKQLKLNGAGMHRSLGVTQNDTEAHGGTGVTQTCEGNMSQQHSMEALWPKDSARKLKTVCARFPSFTHAPKAGHTLHGVVPYQQWLPPGCLESCKNTRETQCKPNA